MRRPIVDAAVAHATAWGGEVRGVSPDDPAAGERSRASTSLPDDACARCPRRGSAGSSGCRSALLALVALVAVVLPLWQKRELRDRDHQPRRGGARSRPRCPERLRTELERAAGDYNFALERKHAWPPMVQVLDTVTRVLPDDTWLTQLEIRTLPKGKDRDRELMMRGESGNAGRLIPVLEESGMVAQVAPRSPTTKIQPGPGRGVRPRRAAASRCRSPRSCRSSTRRRAGCRAASPPPAAEPRAGDRRPTPTAATPAPAAAAARPAATAPPRRRAPKAAARRRPDPCPSRPTASEAMTPAFLARLTPAQSRALALGAARRGGRRSCSRSLLAPVLLLHRHYDDAIETWTTRLATYRRVAAQAPALRNALDVMRTKDARRFFLKNTAPNLAGAELQELVKSAIEQATAAASRRARARRRATTRGFRQIVANVQFFATTPNLQRILHALETKEPLLVVDNITIRPTNAFRGFKPAAGQEPEVNVQLDVSAWALPEPAAKPRPRRRARRRDVARRPSMSALDPRLARWLAVARAVRAARARDRHRRPAGARDLKPRAARRGAGRAGAGRRPRSLPEFRIDGGLDAMKATVERPLFNSTRRPAPPAVAEAREAARSSAASSC